GSPRKAAGPVTDRKLPILIVSAAAGMAPAARERAAAPAKAESNGDRMVVPPGSSLAARSPKRPRERIYVFRYSIANFAARAMPVNGAKGPAGATIWRRAPRGAAAA